ncbi:MAG TPA: c-type cytochrome, partial [Afifellaceae bacterium]|nr:c-type cytochrome [Afifellaceae bacterium]
DYEHLNGFLIAPKKYVSGTSMGFAGLKKPADRANIIAYLRSLADDPAPLPEAAAEAPTAEAPAEMAAEAPVVEAPASAEAPAPAETPVAETPAVEVPAAEAPAAQEPAAEAPAPVETPAAEAAPEMDAPAAPAQSDSMAASPVLAMIGEMSVEDGVKVAKKCAACHSFDEGGKNKVGPPLWGIVNSTAGTAENFRYSDAMKAFGEGGGAWDYATLDAFLANPKDTVPKTKMSFAGLKKVEDRAAILAYLRTLASEPVPLP